MREQEKRKQGSKCHFMQLWLAVNPSRLRIGMIFLLYAAAISFLLMGVQLFYEEQTVERTLQARICHAVSAGEGTALYSVQKKQKLQKGIAEHVIRLHILANSDSAEDQRLKLQVRDQVITGLQDALQDVDSIGEAEKKIAARLESLKQTVTRFIRQRGYSYEAEVSLADQMFPVKKYGDLTFPAGIYRALCIRIGSADGHNWWCVLFPSLCFVDETTAVVPEESKKRLRENLTDEEYKALEEPEPRSFLYDWITSKT